MAFTTPSTVTGADILSASLWNTQVRDNFLEVHNPPTCRLTQGNSTQSWTSPTYTPIDYQSAVWDSDSNGAMWDVANPSRITIRTSGIYLFQFSGYATSTTNMQGFTALILRNGANLGSFAEAVFWPPTVNSTQAYFSATFIDIASATDYYESRIGASGGGTVTLNPFSYNNPAYFTAVRISGT